jgi:cytochrome c oxidase cbb3-type subunit IV
MTTYTSLAGFAQSFGLLYFMAIFAAVLAYALWPRNSRRFEEAANLPLRED